MKNLSNNILDKLQLKGPHILIYGLILISVYKVWKVATFNVFVQPLDEYLHYVAFEFLKTLYRIFATLVGFLIIKKYYHNFRLELIKDNLKITTINFFLILPLFFLSRLWLFDFSFYPNEFAREIFFNFFTGTYEEIAFRGLILVGLAQYFKPMHSILLSSLLFSLWHYDVINHPASYIIIFFWGLYAGLCYLRGNSLASLIVFHFLWDQIFFGFSWSSSTVVSEYLVTLFVLIILAPFIWYLWRNKFTNKNDNYGVAK